jgi:uncharacterized protein with GYD domain
MARYLFEIAVAPQAFGAMIKNPHNRAEATRPAFEALGGTLEEYYFAVGQNTVYTVAQFPDEVTVEAITMAVLAGGAVTSIKSTAVLTAAEALVAMQKASDTVYEPPSS